MILLKPAYVQLNLPCKVDVPVQELPRRLLAMMMACFDSSATWPMSFDHTQYLMKGVLSSAMVLRCWTSNSTTCTTRPVCESALADPVGSCFRYFGILRFKPIGCQPKFVRKASWPLQLIEPLAKNLTQTLYTYPLPQILLLPDEHCDCGDNVRHLAYPLARAKDSLEQDEQQNAFVQLNVPATAVLGCTIVIHQALRTEEPASCVREATH